MCTVTKKHCSGVEGGFSPHLRRKSRSHYHFLPKPNIGSDNEKVTLSVVKVLNYPRLRASKNRTSESRNVDTYLRVVAQLQPRFRRKRANGKRVSARATVNREVHVRMSCAIFYVQLAWAREKSSPKF